MNCPKCKNPMKEIEVLDQAGDSETVKSVTYTCEKCNVVTDLKSLIEQYLKAVDKSVSVKEVLMALREAHGEPTLCIIPIAEHMFDLITARKLSRIHGKPTRFKWVV